MFCWEGKVYHVYGTCIHANRVLRTFTTLDFHLQLYGLVESNFISKIFVFSWDLKALFTSKKRPPWLRLLHEKSTVSKLVKKFPSCMKMESSLQFSQNFRKLICPSYQGRCSRRSFMCIRSSVAQKQLYKYVKHESWKYYVVFTAPLFEHYIEPVTSIIHFSPHNFII
jgi:hypothetical protein